MKNGGEIRWLQLPNLYTVIPEKLELLGEKLNEQFAATTDFIVITGNLYQDDKQPDKVLGFLNQLAKGIDKKDIIIVFGDADIKYQDDPQEIEEQKRLIKYAQKRIQYDMPLNFTDTESNALLSRFVKYSNLLKKFYIQDSAHESYENHIHVYENTISLLCINTAYISDCNYDHIKAQAFDIRGFDELQNYQYPCIAVMHHDFYEIAETQQDILMMKLDELGVSAILCDHRLQNKPNFVLLKDGTRIPIFCCGKSRLQSGDEYMECEILEYIWNVSTETVNMKLYKWNHSKSAFQHIANNKFPLRNMNTSAPNKREDKRDKPGPRTTYIWEIILMTASAVLTVIFLLLLSHNNGKSYPEYKETTQSGSCVFEMPQEYPKFRIQTIGQIVLKAKDGSIVQTYIIDGMYNKLDIYQATKKFEIKREECFLANFCFQSFEKELELILEQKGFDRDELILKDIGFVAVSLPLSGTDEWSSDYYIFEDNSLHYLSEETAQMKMVGIHLTEEIWENAEEWEKILNGFRECILIELTRKAN